MGLRVRMAALAVVTAAAGSTAACSVTSAAVPRPTSRPAAAAALPQPTATGHRDPAHRDPAHRDAVPARRAGAPGDRRTGQS